VAAVSPAFSLTAAQREMADLIQREFRGAGFSAGVGMAAVANAYAESRLNPLAATVPSEKNNYEDSAGLFQLNVKGVGHGMTREERLDPVTNTRKMVGYAKRESRFAGVANDPDATLHDLTRAFTVYLERPADAERKGEQRAALASQMFPEAYKVSGRALARMGSGAFSPTALALAGSGAALLLLLAWRFRDDIRASLTGDA
jgi:hypothetical protein